MNVDNLDVQLVARTPGEAQDLGLQLLRRHAGATFGAAALVMAPIWGSLLVLGIGRFWLTLFAVWWTLPIISRVTVHVLSRAVFGGTPTVVQTVAALPTIFDRSLIETLTWRRIQLRRGLWMPTAALERLRGVDLRDRYRAIAWGNLGSQAILTTLTFVAMTVALALATLILGVWFIPEGLLPNVEEAFAVGLFADGSSLEGYSWILVATFLPAMLVMDVACTAAGFGMYLSRRTELEGWHIELAFRRMAARVEAVARRGIAIALPWLLAGAALLGSAAGAQEEEVRDFLGPSEIVESLEEQIDEFFAEEDTEDAVDALPAEHPRRIAHEVLASEEFDRTVERTAWKFIWEDAEDASGGSAGGGAGLGPLLGGLLQGAFWILIVGLVTWLVVYVARNVDLSRRARAERPAPRPTEAFGLDLRRDSLPDDIPGAARALATQGDIVGALSLLYRGALHHLVERDELEIQPGDTEHDCMRRVREVAAGRAVEERRADYFSALTERWLRAAWGASPPGQGETIELCEGWPAHFAAHSAGERAA